MGACPLCADSDSRPRQRDVVQVVARGLGKWPVLAPARHPAIDQPGIERRAICGAEAQPLHHPWAKAFDQSVGLGNQFQCARLATGRLQVDDLDLLAAVQRVLHRPAQPLRPSSLLGPCQRDHLGAHVDQHPGGQRAWTDALKLHHTDAVQRQLQRVRHVHSFLETRSFRTSLAPP